MRCPFCGHEETVVKDSRPNHEQSDIRRRRLCTACGLRFNTVERIYLRELSVVKQDGSTEPFDQEKLLRSLRSALHKRAIPREQIERITTSIRRKLEMSGDSEVSSKVIGDLAMDALRELDTVAYIRFSSIYKGFKSDNDFRELLESID
jgi:transcriptional repressor NrdR